MQGPHKPLAAGSIPASAINVVRRSECRSEPQLGIGMFFAPYSDLRTSITGWC